MKSRPFRLYGASVDAKVLDYACAVVREWAESWTAHAVSDSSSDAQLLDVAVASVKNWRYLAADTEHQFGLNTEGDWVGGIPEILYGSLCGDPQCNQSGILAQELLDSMLADLAARAFKRPASAEQRTESLISTPISAEASLPGSGFVVARVSVTSAHHLWLLMSPQFVDSIDGGFDHRASQTNIVSPIQAIGNRRVSVQLAVGSGEITIEELSSLAVGDVIPLNRKIDEEIDVCINGDTPVCRGYIGTSQGKIAVQLSSNS